METDCDRCFLVNRIRTSYLLFFSLFNRWFTSPTTVNAFYSSSTNQISEYLTKPQFNYLSEKKEYPSAFINSAPHNFKIVISSYCTKIPTSFRNCVLIKKNTNTKCIVHLQVAKYIAFADWLLILHIQGTERERKREERKKKER